MRRSTRGATHAVGTMMIVLAVAFLFWHLVLYWIVHVDLTWVQVLEAKQHEVRGGVGLLLWGVLGWVVPELWRHRDTNGPKTYRIRHHGRRVDK